MLSESHVDKSSDDNDKEASDDCNKGVTTSRNFFLCIHGFSCI